MIFISSNNLQRETGYDVNPIFPSRWSSRAMSGERIEDKELFSLFEAARWTPSYFNNQHWRFLYAKIKHRTLGQVL